MARQNEFTPGPWKIEFDADSSPNIWIEAETNCGICKIETCNYDDGLGHRLTDEDWANARLIAAAPELLGALKMMISGKVVGSVHALHPSKWFCEVCGRNSEIAIHSDNCPVLIAEKAIAKAEGRPADDAEVA